jgi:hypothetical protein
MSSAPTPSSAGSKAQVVIAVILVGAALHWMAPLLTPLALALFLMVLIDGLARMIRTHLPRLGPAAALAAAIVICIVAFAGTVYIVANNAAAFVGKLVQYEPRLNQLLQRLAHTFHGGVPRTVNQLVALIDPGQYVPMVAGGAQTLVTTAVLVLVYLGFMLASRRGFERKTVRLFHGRAERHEALNAFLRVRDALEQYVWIQTVCGSLIALLSWITMMALGLESAFFWAFLIFVIGWRGHRYHRPGGVRPGPVSDAVDRADPVGGDVQHRLPGGQHPASAHAGARPQPRRGDGAVFAGILGGDLGTDGNVPVDAPDGPDHGDPRAVRRLPVDRHPAVRGRRPARGRPRDPSGADARTFTQA